MAELLRLLSLPSSTPPFFSSSSSQLHTLKLSLRPSLSLSSLPRRLPLIKCSTAAGQSPSSESEAEELSRTRLLAQNVPWTCSIDDIRQLFQQHGTVVDVELSMHNKTRNRGLAFVEMGSPEEAVEALQKLEKQEFEGRKLKLNYARPKKKKIPSAVQPKQSLMFNLFVANLSFEARAKDLREFFSSGGSDVVSAEVIFHDNPRRSAGYGFVSFRTKNEADAALAGFQGKELMGRPIRLERSRRFVKTEGEMKSESEEDPDLSSESNETLVEQ